MLYVFQFNIALYIKIHEEHNKINETAMMEELQILI